ncbi:MAG: HEPN domain-containing protein [Thaumarchaeota archaeon]|nr:HEPN domain-containing protein [Nitrososphaerota archaeon]MCL5316749.1 HEPN domain-containing protein [Nitrososphaerota archaeon]
MADNRISPEITQLLADRKLLIITPKRNMILKEIEGAQEDLKDAEDSLQAKKLKWATIQAYYSLFHSARALLYSRGFREKSHYALFIAIRELFLNELGRDLVSSFENAMELRQEADYGLKFSEEGATETIKGAAGFLAKAKALLKIEE